MYDFFMQINLALVNANFCSDDLTRIDQHEEMSFVQSQIVKQSVNVYAGRNNEKKDYYKEETKEDGPNEIIMQISTTSAPVKT